MAPRSCLLNSKAPRSVVPANPNYDSSISRGRVPRGLSTGPYGGSCKRNCNGSNCNNDWSQPLRSMTPPECLTVTNWIR